MENNTDKNIRKHLIEEEKRAYETGKRIANINKAKNMLLNDYKIEEIAEITGLSIDEIKELHISLF